jgi:hypothetical protein
VKDLGAAIAAIEGVVAEAARGSACRARHGISLAGQPTGCKGK